MRKFAQVLCCRRGALKWPEENGLSEHHVWYSAFLLDLLREPPKLTCRPRCADLQCDLYIRSSGAASRVSNRHGLNCTAARATSASSKAPPRGREHAFYPMCITRFLQLPRCFCPLLASLDRSLYKTGPRPQSRCGWSCGSDPHNRIAKTSPRRAPVARPTGTGQ